MSVAGFANTVHAQFTITDDFNDGNEVGWSHYAPGVAAGQVNSYTFPADDSTGLAYRLIGPPSPQCSAFINRGGAYRSEQYTEFFQSVDVINFDPKSFASAFFLGSRLGTPGAGTTTGYIMASTAGSPRARQELTLNIEFTGEFNSTIVDFYRGGAALTSQFPPSRKLRVKLTGTNNPINADLNLFTAEIYDQTDLLEPLVKINFHDAVNGSLHTSGENALGWLNLDYHEQCDFTWDNYYATASRNTPVGFPGTPQVRSLVPGPQALFYSIPASNQITFTATTFTTNQVATNTLRLFLNGVDVSGGLSFTEVTNLFGSPKTNYAVRWNGTLSSNTVYNGRIIVLNPAGKGTTNTWAFDTFQSFNPTATNNPTGFLLIEAEDYNFNSGQFQDYPPVSGTDDTTTSRDQILAVDNSTTPPTTSDPPPEETLGPQVNGFSMGAGYYDAVGAPDIDFHTSNTDLDPIVSQQYRSQDTVATTQGTKGGGFDTPRAHRMGLANANAGTSYVPDYIVGNMRAGDWLNYTRVFPNGNYNVYLRASSQGRQDVRLDQVIGDRTQPDQTKVLRGQFLVPNTESLTRFRYVPLTDGAGNIQTLSLGGTNTLRLTANQVRVEEVLDIGDLQLNWLLFVPAPGVSPQRPFVASALPSRNSENFSPEGIVQIIILNRDTTVIPGIELRLDGVNVTASASITNTTSEGGGATITYDPPGFFLPKSSHTLKLVFGDGSVTQTNEWTFTIDPEVPLLSPSDAVGGVPDTFFTVKISKAANDEAAGCVLVDAFDNSIARAEHHLSGTMVNPDTLSPYDNEAAGTSGGLYTETNSINYEQCAGAVGFFGGDVAYPGIDPTNHCNGTLGYSDPNNFSMTATIKLQLAPGFYRMGVNSDDAFRVAAGGAGGTNVVLGDWETIPGTRGDGQFDFVVQAAGLYNFRLVHEEGDGGAYCEWYWVNRATGDRTLVTPTQPIQLFSSPTVTGTYIVEGTAVIDTGTKTVTVAKSGSTRFYRLSSSSPLNITNITLSGSNVVLKYQ